MQTGDGKSSLALMEVKFVKNNDRKTIEMIQVH